MAKLVFADKKPDPRKAGGTGRGWTVLIVDDDPEVHSITELALRNLSFLGRPIHFVHAYSGGEAVQVIDATPDIALILLDVVMETDDAGLRFVEHVRNRIGNHKVRIVLRTGQPGQAPEQEVILRYDINDYKAKTELTQQKLYTTVITALRGYQDLMAIESGREGLRRIIDASASLMQSRSMRMFASGVLTHLGGLLGTSGCGILCTQAEARVDGALTIIAASGKFETLMAQPAEAVDPEVIARIRAVLDSHTTVVADSHTILYLRTPNYRDVAVYVEADHPLDDLDRSLLEVFGTNISIGFDNLEMIDRIIHDNEVLERRVAERTRDLHDREARLRAILEASPIAVAILGLEDGRARLVNSRLRHLLGTEGDAGDIDAIEFSGLFAEPDDHQRVADELAVEEGRIRDLEVRVRRVDGGHLWGLLSARRLMVDGDPCALVWLYDISQRMEMEHELRQLATTDPLTGVANRRHFLDLAEQECQRSRRYGHDLTVVMADIDHFKKINDGHGHQVGDRVIVAFATALQGCLRACDMVGRLGGEEFAVILPETPAAVGEMVAERIRAAIAAITADVANGETLRLTASFGCATLSSRDASIDATLARADAALYRSKDAGRNRVTAAPE